MRLPRTLAISAACAISAAPALSWGSFIAIDASGKGTLSSFVKTGYRGRGSDARDFGDDIDVRNIRDTRPRWRSDALHTESAAFTTTTSLPHASAHARTLFTFGTPVGTPALDTVEFRVWATVDAAGARNHAHNSSTARVTAQDAFSFTTIGGSLPAGSVVGKIRVSPLRHLQPYEKRLQFDLFKDGDLLRGAEDGSRGFSMPLLSDSDYQLRLLYRISVPHKDPDFSVSAWATLQPAGLGAPRPPIVPDPPMSVLVLAAAPVLCRRTRRGAPASRRSAGSTSPAPPPPS